MATFYADTHNSRIRKVDTNGNITTMAGNSSAGFSGDGEMATNASLHYPESVALDGAATCSLPIILIPVCAKWMFTARLPRCRQGRLMVIPVLMTAGRLPILP